MGITIDSAWFEPNTNSSDDSEAALRALQMNVRVFAHSVHSLFNFVFFYFSLVGGPTQYFQKREITRK